MMNKFKTSEGLLAHLKLKGQSTEYKKKKKKKQTTEISNKSYVA